MKHLLKLVLIVGFTVTTTALLPAQTAVEQAIITSEIVKNDASKSNVKTLKKDYKKALKEINKLKSSAVKKVEINEEIAIQGGDWVELQNNMKHLSQMSVLNFEVDNLDLEKTWITAKEKICDFYFEKGKTELGKSNRIDRQLDAFGLLDKASEFASKNDSAINQLKKEILLPRALELAKSWKTRDKATALTILNDI